MSKRVNPVSIGLFIVAGVALGLGALILFSSSKLFTRTETFVLYFDESLKGLNLGAPVKYRGVTIGSVVDVLIHFNQAEGDIHMPVLIEVSEELLRGKIDIPIKLSGEGSFLQTEVGKGLRGKLEAQSLVTGLLYVELDVIPNAPPPVFHQQRPEYQEIPTAPTRIQKMLQNLAEFDIPGLSDKLNAVLDRVNTSLGELQVKEISAGLTNLLASANTVVNSPGLTNSLATLQEALGEYRRLAERLGRKMEPLAADASRTLAGVDQTLAEVRNAVADLRSLLAPHAPLMRDAASALDQLGNAAQAIGELADYLNRNPGALLRGRDQTDPKR